MTSFNPTHYAPLIAELLREPWLPPLDAGTPNREVRVRLEALSSDNAFAPHPVRDRGMADACRAGLWLYHNFLDESHRISQELHTPTGSYWHALMHRREPDFDNTKYTRGKCRDLGGRRARACWERSSVFLDRPCSACRVSARDGISLPPC